MARLNWPARLALNFIPGANLLTIADILASIRDGSLAAAVRGQFLTIGHTFSGLIVALGAAGALYHHANASGWPAAQPWLVVVAIGAGLAILVQLAGRWIAEGFGGTTELPADRR
jgi:hypothetical protein